ncbi:MAG: hypothetical protein Q8O64_09040 [Sideroxyarcus sp.]|nr:hypothetical protein [Sideroxyarcus sp.]
MSKISKPEYETKVKKLSAEEVERLLSRMAGKLPRRLRKEKLTREEALAIQLELEDEQLQEWRKMMLSLKKKEESGKKVKAAEKGKSAIKFKVEAKAKSPAKPKIATKSKTPVQAPVAAKKKVTPKPI